MQNLFYKDTAVNNDFKLLNLYKRSDFEFAAGRQEPRENIFNEMINTAKSISVSPSIDDTFRTTLKNALNITNYERGIILLKNDLNNYEIKTAVDSKGTAISVMPSSIFRPIVDKVYYKQIKDYAETMQESHNNELRHFKVPENLRTILCVPLFSEEKNYGVLYLDKKGRDKSIDDNLAKIEFAAIMLGMNITNHELKQDKLNYVTEIEELKNQLGCAMEKAEESKKLKSEFLAHISHEIRTPINVIIHYLDVVGEELKDNISSDTEFFFNAVKANSKRLTRLIDLILNLAQLRSGKIKVQPRCMDIEKDVIVKLFNEFKNDVSEKKVKLLFDDCSSEKLIHADHYCVTQIFTQLLDSSIKYADKGTLKINLYNEQDKVCVSIQNEEDEFSGKGKYKLLKDFTPGNSQFGNSNKSYSLGITLVQEFVNLNKGQLIIAKSENGGYKFIVKFNSLGTENSENFS